MKGAITHSTISNHCIIIVTAPLVSNVSLKPPLQKKSSPQSACDYLTLVVFNTGDWVQFYILYQQCIGYMRRPCSGHEVPFLWVRVITMKSFDKIFHDFQSDVHYILYMFFSTVCNHAQNGYWFQIKAISQVISNLLKFTYTKVLTAASHNSPFCIIASNQTVLK